MHNYGTIWTIKIKYAALESANNSTSDYEIKIWKKQLEKCKQQTAIQEYMRSMRCWYRSWIVLRFSLNAAVTRPESGVQTSDTNFKACGISNFSKRRLTAYVLTSSNINLSTLGFTTISSILVHLIPSVINRPRNDYNYYRFTFFFKRHK